MPKGACCELSKNTDCQFPIVWLERMRERFFPPITFCHTTCTVINLPVIMPITVSTFGQLFIPCLTLSSWPLYPASLFQHSARWESCVSAHHIWNRILQDPKQLLLGTTSLCQGTLRRSSPDVWAHSKAPSALRKASPLTSTTML